MPVSTSDIQSISQQLNANSLVNDPGAISGAIDSFSTSIKDPIGASLSKALVSLNGLSNMATSKIDELQSNIVSSNNNYGSVKLVGSNLIISVEEKDTKKATEYKNKIENNIASVNSAINKMTVINNSLSVIGSTIKVVKTALDVQEAVLSINPISKATLTVFKKAIKILFYKDVLAEYGNILNKEVQSNRLVINNLKNKFKDLRVELNVIDQKNQGKFITTEDAENMIPQQQLDVDTSYSGAQDYFDGTNTYRLSVEKYGSKQLVGKAYEVVSGLLYAETSPSFISTPSDLIEEIKSILSMNQ